MYILGISAYYHDSAACLVHNGHIVAAAQEERFTRYKHDASFPTNAVRFCLSYAGLSLADLAAVAFYEKPFIKFERLIETYYATAPRSLRSFAVALPSWLKEKLFLRSAIERELLAISSGPLPPLYFPDHHLSHAASAFFPSPFGDAAIITVDGVGEWATTAIFHGSEAGIKSLRELHFPHSWGLLYSAFTHYLGFRVNSGEYKLMGLAPYGDKTATETKAFEATIRSQLIDIKDDGSLWLDQSYFDYATGLSMTVDARWKELFSLPRRAPQDDLTQSHANLALAIQDVLEDGLLRLSREAKRLTGASNLCLAGGVALNCTANRAIRESGTFANVWIQPAAGDAGGAMGAALSAWHIALDKPRQPKTPSNDGDTLSGAYLGPEFSDLDIAQIIRKYDAQATHVVEMSQLVAETAAFLDQGLVVGWFQGRMEWGPRALGNRSILADPRRQEMQQRLNLAIKYREGFRPFAPAILAEDAEAYFPGCRTSPYMLFTAPIADKLRVARDRRDTSSPLLEQLKQSHSTIPAVTHLDYSARVQTVHRETNLLFWELLSAFKRRSGCPVLVNTSFNVRGEPIACTPDDAYRCFMSTEIDVLVLGNYVFLKGEQPNTKDWMAKRGAKAED